MQNLHNKCQISALYINMKKPLISINPLSVCIRAIIYGFQYLSVALFAISFYGYEETFLLDKSEKVQDNYYRQSKYL